MNLQNNDSDDPLETWLCQAPAPLPDEGFTQRVLATLPPPPKKPRSLPSRRTIALILGALIGCSVSLSQSGSPQESLAVSFAEWISATATLAGWFSNPALLGVGAIVSAAIALSYRQEIARKLNQFL